MGAAEDGADVSEASTFAREYAYAAPGGSGAGNTTPLVSRLSYTRSGTPLTSFSYTYDNMGRIQSDGTYTYTYDPWGKVLSVANGSGTAITDPYQVGALNPLRYRGYYYDTDTQLYYLQSRYYDPEVSRFIKADAYASTGQGIVGYNMFAYCNNDPINYVDIGGYDAAVATYGGASWWALRMWFIALLDGPLPIGDAIYWAGVSILALYDSTELQTSKELEKTDVSLTALAAKKEKSKADNDVTIKSSSRGTSASPTPPPPNKKPSLKRVSENLLKKFGLDAHEIKREYLGNKAKISRYDLSYDTKTGIIYIVTKAQEIVMMTDYNVKYLPY